MITEERERIYYLLVMPSDKKDIGIFYRITILSNFKELIKAANFLESMCQITFYIFC